VREEMITEFCRATPSENGNSEYIEDGFLETRVVRMGDE
jgi:hypothetical protein